MDQLLSASTGPHDRPRTDLSPGELQRAIGELTVCPPTGIPLGEALRTMGATVWDHGVAPEHPWTAAHLHAPTLIPAVVTELAIAAANQSMDSWDQAPAATHVELELLSWLAQQFGLGAGSSGVMTSGGTASNLLGLTLARSRESERHGVDVLAEGLPPQAVNWRILASADAHFSVARAASLLGLGRNQVIAVPTSPDGAMDLTALDGVLASLATAGLRPLAIVATAGTTDLGAIDPLDEVAERARRAGCWFHVDAAVGGALVLSDRHRDRLSGIEVADSVTVDFHKLWWQPISASALVVRDEQVFDLIRVRSAYLDRGDEPTGMVNLVGRSLDTSRRFDAAKVMVSLRTVGREVLGAMVDHVLDLAQIAADEVQRSSGVSLAAPVSTVMCTVRSDQGDPGALRRTQQRLLLDGRAVIGRSTLGSKEVLKLTFVNPMATEAEVRSLVRLVVDELAAER